MSQKQPEKSENRRIPAQSSNEKIVQWLSPGSDHFPTPRGFHFLSAPILPESPLTASVDESNSPSTDSWNAWNRQSVSTDVTEFDDIYDVSDDDGGIRRKPSRKTSLKRANSSRATAPKTPGTKSLVSQRGLPRLEIPAQPEQDADSWSGRRVLKKLASPVPPTPPAKVEMSPAIMSYMQAQQVKDVPTISAPPSLDGSLSSDQMATMSAPPTPIIGAGESVAGSDWSGVQLQPAALATLQALSGVDENERETPPEQVIELPEGRIPEMSQQTPRAFATLRPILRLSTEQQQHQQSLSGLTRLSIPSPGGFFSGLSPRSRHTWHLPTMTPDDIAPPTSTTAEQFYRCPWNQPAPPVPSLPDLFSSAPRPELFVKAALSLPVEHIVEVRASMSDGCPTARPAILEQTIQARDLAPEGPPTARRIEPSSPQVSSPIPVEPVSPKEAVVATEIVTVYDPEYAKKLQGEALSNLDRTELWLMAQKAYMKGVLPEDHKEAEPEFTAKSPDVQIKEEPKTKEPETGSDVSALQRKKTVRFSEIIVKGDIPCRLPPKLLRQESAYYRAFQDHLIQSRSQDAFVHCLSRFEALQAQRISLREAYRNQLLGKYQLSVVPQSAKKRMSANVARGDHIIAEDDPEKIRREKEIEARSQMAAATWHIGALKALNGGRLFSAPVDRRLRRLSMQPQACSGRDRPRILDLGGQATCDWAWHCAFAYPAAKVYTATTKAARQLSNSNIRGPPNHRQVAVERLARLPFPDGHFDLVSARELHTALKFVGENGADEWEAALAECFRVLKPGGYLEFAVLDSDLMNAGPLGLAKSVEFGFTLKTLGYDPQPTRLFLGRLRRAGFDGVRRAWLCLPVGSEQPKPKMRSPPPAGGSARNSTASTSTTTAAGGRKLELEAMVTGTTKAAAGLAGLAGGWAWERWLLRCEMEKVASEGRLQAAIVVGTPQEMREAGKCLEDVHAVIEEGRRCGAGFRVLSGFARKPRE